MLRERVRLLGGSVQAGPEDDSWILRADIPTGESPVTAGPGPTAAVDITVLIADDEPLVRSGLRAILDSEPGLRVIGGGGRRRSGRGAGSVLRPDVICMDVRMPSLDGIRATELVLRLDRPPRVLVVTTFASDDYVLEAMRAGAAASC